MHIIIISLLIFPLLWQRLKRLQPIMHNSSWLLPVAPTLSFSFYVSPIWWWIVCMWVAVSFILVAGGYDNCYDNRSTWTKVNHFLSSPRRFLWWLHFTFPLVMSISGVWAQWASCRAAVSRTRCWLWPCVRSLVCSHPLSHRPCFYR